MIKRRKKKKQMTIELECLHHQPQKILERAPKIRRVGSRRVRRRERDLMMMMMMIRIMKVRMMRSFKRGELIESSSRTKVDTKEKMQISIIERITIIESIAVVVDIHQSEQVNLNPVENNRETLLILIISTHLIEEGHPGIDTIVKGQERMNEAVGMIIHPNEETDPCLGG